MLLRWLTEKKCLVLWVAFLWVACSSAVALVALYPSTLRCVSARPALMGSGRGWATVGLPHAALSLWDYRRREAACQTRYYWLAWKPPEDAICCTRGLDSHQVWPKAFGSAGLWWRLSVLETAGWGTLEDGLFSTHVRIVWHIAGQRFAPTTAVPGLEMCFRHPVTASDSTTP